MHCILYNLSFSGVFMGGLEEAMKEILSMIKLFELNTKLPTSTLDIQKPN